MKFNLFYSNVFRNIICSTYSCYDRSHDLGLSFPVLQSKSFLIKNMCSSPFQFYQTKEYFNSDTFHSDLQKINEFSARVNRNYSLKIVGEMLPVDDFGFVQLIARNPVLSMRSADETFSNFSKNHKQNVRKERNKAFREEISVSIENTQLGLDDFYNLLAFQSVRRHKMVFHPKSLFKKLLETKICDIIIARVHGEAIAALFCLKDADVYHYSWGVRKTYRNVNLGTYLLDFALSHACSQSYKYFDFGSTPLSDLDLLNYKLKWGAENHPVYEYSTLFNNISVDLNSTLPNARSVFSKIPLGLAKISMPYVVPYLFR